MKGEKWNKKVFFYSTSIRTIPKMERYYLRMSKFIGYRTSHEKGFLVFGVPNAKYLAFGTPDENLAFGTPDENALRLTTLL